VIIWENTLKSNKSGWLLAAITLSVASVIAWVDFGLYVSRLPGDGVGIGLNAVIALAFTFAAVGFYIQWNKIRRKPED
jgi:MFS superfamily sulfate permease-like transporter